MLKQAERDLALSGSSLSGLGPVRQKAAFHSDPGDRSELNERFFGIFYSDSPADKSLRSMENGIYADSGSPMGNYMI
jgi:hypothetical protein